MHPYKNLPEENFWRSGVSDKLWPDINFKPTTQFRLEPQEKIASAGSCFAQHIARNLPALGLTHFVSEPAPKILTQQRAEELQYGVFSARYGNIYTARQLRQLIEFAFDLRERTVLEDRSADGWIDLLRTGVQAEGFDSLHDLRCDREFHLSCVRRLFLEADCFIFTLGLTETWYHEETGIVFPACPGTKVGTFNAGAHRFTNATVTQVIEDLRWCIEFVRTKNFGLKWIFTVSPVALAATATNQHVLVATAESKAILRTAAAEICNAYANCEYFPSFEIVSSAATFGQFLDTDLRSIAPRGVSLVMRIFQRTLVAESTTGLHAATTTTTAEDTNSMAIRIRAAVKAECDEVFNDPHSV